MLAIATTDAKFVGGWPSADDAMRDEQGFRAHGSLQLDSRMIPVQIVKAPFMRRMIPTGADLSMVFGRARAGAALLTIQTYGRKSRP